MPHEIWCIKQTHEEQLHKMIVMTLASKTLVLTTTASGYSQTKDTGLEEETATIHVGRLEDDSLVQIVPWGFKHIRRDKTAKTMKF